jgi:uncharacterized protein (UPF0276 family)
MAGVGLRREHYGEALDGQFRFPLVEIITENVLGRGGRPRAAAFAVRRSADVVLHGVSLGIGNCEPLDVDFVRRVRQLADELDVRWVSDHACFTGAHGYVGHDLWPLPLTLSALEHLVPRIAQVQDLLGRRLVLENVSRYVRFVDDEMPEDVFLTELLRRADCELLLDLNNVVVNAHNFGFDALAFVRAMPAERIRQLHLSGHANCGTHRFDDHASEVGAEVWALFESFVALKGPKPTIIEWDGNVPSFSRLAAEAHTADALARRAGVSPMPGRTVERSPEAHSP